VNSILRKTSVDGVTLFGGLTMAGYVLSMVVLLISYSQPL
jgi:hypothetical protein